MTTILENIIPKIVITNLLDDFNNNLIDELYYNQLFDILQQLTDAPKISYRMLVLFIKNLPFNQNIYVYKVLKSSPYDDKIAPCYEIVGTITLIIEQKLIHGGSKCGHIEDLVVHEKWRSKGIAQELLIFAKDICRCVGCYKVILDCHEKLEGFYKKNGFAVGGQMMRYNIME